MDSYSILGIDAKTSFKDIKRIYYKLALLNHPDKGGDVEVFKKITKAFEYIKEINELKLDDENIQNLHIENKDNFITIRNKKYRMRF